MRNTLSLFLLFVFCFSASGQDRSLQKASAAQVAAGVNDSRFITPHGLSAAGIGNPTNGVTQASGDARWLRPTNIIILVTNSGAGTLSVPSALLFTNPANSFAGSGTGLTFPNGLTNSSGSLYLGTIGGNAGTMNLADTITAAWDTMTFNSGNLTVPGGLVLGTAGQFSGNGLGITNLPTPSTTVWPGGISLALGWPYTASVGAVTTNVTISAFTGVVAGATVTGVLMATNGTGSDKTITLGGAIRGTMDGLRTYTVTNGGRLSITIVVGPHTNGAASPLY